MGFNFQRRGAKVAEGRRAGVDGDMYCALCGVIWESRCLCYMRMRFVKCVFAMALWGCFASLSVGQEEAVEADPFEESKKLAKEAVTEVGDLPKMIRVQVEFIDVSHEVVTELLFGEEVPADDVAMRKRVSELIKEGKASVMETMMCVARDGQKASSDSFQEFIYPTEYEPAEIANTIEIDKKDDVEMPKVNPRDYATGPTPTAFETKNIGPSLEIEPRLEADGKHIDLNFSPRIVYHVGNEVWAEWEGKHGNSPIQMPKFYKISLNSRVTLAAGKTMFVAVVSPKDEQGKTDVKRRLMVFVKAVVVVQGD